jgi:hypothetical protein
VRKLLFVLFPLLVAADAGAQIIRRPGYGRGEPSGWFTAGAALVQPWSVADGATGSRWEFGDAMQYSASLEKTLSGGASLGVRGTYARVPLTYRSTGAAAEIVQTDADARVSQLFATVHVANGDGFHTVLELTAGATVYHDFRDRAQGTKLAPDKPDADFTFALGYGFGYAFSRKFSIDVVQDLTTVLHQKTGLAAGDKSSARINGTRLVARFGLGGR